MFGSATVARSTQDDSIQKPNEVKPAGFRFSAKNTSDRYRNLQVLWLQFPSSGLMIMTASLKVSG